MIVQSKLAPMICILVVSANTQMVAAEENTLTEISLLWSDYVEFCSIVVLDPSSQFVELNSVAEDRVSTWAASKDGSSVHVSASLPDYSRSASFHLHDQANGYSVFCESHSFTFGESDVIELASAVNIFLTEDLDLEVAGGKLTDLPGATSSLEETGQGPWFSFTVPHIFENTNLITTVDIQANSVAITTFGNIN